MVTKNNMSVVIMKRGVMVIDLLKCDVIEVDVTSWNVRKHPNRALTNFNNRINKKYKESSEFVFTSVNPELPFEAPGSR